MRCFSLEHDPRSRECRECAHYDACGACMGDRKGRVPLSEIVYDLVPDTLTRRDTADHPEDDLEVVYRAAYAKIFGGDPGHSGVRRHQTKIESASRKLKMTPAQFILVSMVGHSMTWPDRDYTPSELVLGYSAKKVKTWANACRETYGSLDIEALDKLTGRSDTTYDLAERMRRCELLAGRWIIKYKLRHGGAPYEPLFEAEQTNLDANWLAIEPHFEHRILDHSKHLSRREGVYDLMADVSEAFRMMKRRPKVALASFLAREKIMPEVVQTVLSDYGLVPDDLLLTNPRINDALKLWFWISLAVQQVGLLNFYRQERVGKVNESPRS